MPNRRGLRWWTPSHDIPSPPAVFPTVSIKGFIPWLKTSCQQYRFEFGSCEPSPLDSVALDVAVTSNVSVGFAFPTPTQPLSAFQALIELRSGPQSV